jgi:hypothetical protein
LGEGLDLFTIIAICDINVFVNILSYLFTPMMAKIKAKGKGHPITCHKGPKGE